MTFTGVAHVAITVEDLARSKSWYSRVLDWQPVMEGEGDGVVFTVGALPGGTVIGLRQYEMGGLDSSTPPGSGWTTWPSTQSRHTN